MSKMMEMKESLIVATGLPDATVQVRNIHDIFVWSGFPFFTVQKDGIWLVEPTHFYHNTCDIVSQIRSEL